jgi:hypothetical protein
MSPWFVRTRSFHALQAAQGGEEGEREDEMNRARAVACRMEQVFSGPWVDSKKSEGLFAKQVEKHVST